MLELVTFTGVDTHTDLNELARIAREYPQAEFAVLAGSQTGGDNPIFPPMETVRALRNLDGVNTALHLCGKYARMAAGETHTPPTHSTCSATASAGCRSTCTRTWKTQQECGWQPPP